MSKYSEDQLHFYLPVLIEVFCNSKPPVLVEFVQKINLGSECFCFRKKIRDHA